MNTLPPSMQAIQISPNHDLTLATLPLPELAAGEVLVRVAYAGINRADILQREGKYAPPAGASPLPGLEVSGVVAALGSAAHGFQAGDAVCALLSGGGYAEYVAAPAGQVLAVPAGISLQQAAALPEAAATSVMALHLEGGLREGERVLVHGGTSGLGLLMVQIAKSWGAEVFTTVGSDEKVAFLAPFGVRALNHRSAPFAEQLMALTEKQGVDLIIDTLGGPHVATHLGLLRRGGRMVSLAMMEGVLVESLKMTRVLTHHLRWSGATLRSRSVAEKAQIMRGVASLVWPHVAVGTIRPVVDQVFALKDAEKALARMQERLHLGKILLEVSPN